MRSHRRPRAAGVGARLDQVTRRPAAFSLRAGGECWCSRAADGSRHVADHAAPGRLQCRGRPRVRCSVRLAPLAATQRLRQCGRHNTAVAWAMCSDAERPRHLWMRSRDGQWRLGAVRAASRREGRAHASPVAQRLDPVDGRGARMAGAAGPEARAARRDGVSSPPQVRPRGRGVQLEVRRAARRRLARLPRICPVELARGRLARARGLRSRVACSTGASVKVPSSRGSP